MKFKLNYQFQCPNDTEKLMLQNANHDHFSKYFKFTVRPHNRKYSTSKVNELVRNTFLNSGVINTKIDFKQYSQIPVFHVFQNKYGEQLNEKKRIKITSEMRYNQI